MSGEDQAKLSEAGKVAESAAVSPEEDMVTLETLEDDTALVKVSQGLRDEQ